MLAILDFIDLAKKRDFEVELKRYSPKRSNKQNNYYHFICSYFAHQYGCTDYEAENVFMKQVAAGHIFEAEAEDKNGNRIRYYRSSADLSQAEMASAIRNFVAYADANGITIPYENDDEGRRFCEQELEKSYGYR